MCGFLDSKYVASAYIRDRERQICLVFFPARHTFRALLVLVTGSHCLHDSTSTSQSSICPFSCPYETRAAL